MTRALISVYDKSGIVDLARVFADAGIDIVSSGGTATALQEAGIAVTGVEDVTGFPECFDGRVKTLHPLIHGGLLADRRKPQHVEQMSELGVTPIDIVIVNLYPFEQTRASGAEVDEIIEQIDIGGPAMVRAAAKNHASVAVLTAPEQYADAVDAVRRGGFTAEERRVLAARAFAHTAAYDAAVATWMSELVGDERIDLSLPKTRSLRYGENPHQTAWLSAEGRDGVAHAVQLGGKDMSYNNYRDTDAAVRAAYDHDKPAVAVIKHMNPCGIAVGADIAQAYARAHACDPVSAYGGVIAANRRVTLAMAERLAPVFTEVVTAPDFDDDALEVLRKKKNLRILKVRPDTAGRDITQISGGWLVQERDRVDAPGDLPSGWTHAAGPVADEDTLADLEFAWRAVRSVRSNAVLLAKGGASVGVGMGQVNRVDSCRLAVERANTLGAAVDSDVETAGGAQQSTLSSEKRAVGSVAASDAFFPFADGFQVLADAGVKAVVQPGGSVRDDEVIAAANAAGVPMYFTGTRHFSH
ncbi:bifunctional phosphoribosylaminoimidazolecarboxamide formyltransferase/IMP cyclohydrolase [Flaviflexus huanghaiensis]|uniref:bifunctional phosphoribosylaminoimidazolecarboxamide formyltransferase/IMP cyclohydrolase n=1 Tax=Flaviflexus huanghaiensis TaxID=1111473 RepID=UPI001F515668|nr:bifunctional phosphoribosylaminoimidazolecarboxamide formyltransferase/IMP cyclohydrolase [Flaviflexus huanghaiensis]